MPRHTLPAWASLESLSTHELIAWIVETYLLKGAGPHADWNDLTRKGSLVSARRTALYLKYMGPVYMRPARNSSRMTSAMFSLRSFEFASFSRRLSFSSRMGTALRHQLGCCSRKSFRSGYT